MHESSTQGTFVPGNKSSVWNNASHVTFHSQEISLLEMFTGTFVT